MRRIKKGTPVCALAMLAGSTALAAPNRAAPNSESDPSLEMNKQQENPSRVIDKCLQAGRAQIVRQMSRDLELVAAVRPSRVD